jgi:acyl carrier protein
MDKFKELVADLLEYDQLSELDMYIPIKDIDEWDSLTLLGFIAMIENEYSIQINVPNLNIDLSFNDFYNKYLVSI